jgi:hypothetical protein
MPPVGQGLLIIEVSPSRSDIQRSVEPPSLRLRDRPVAETSTWQNTTLTKDKDTAGGIWTCNHSKRAAGDPRLRTRGHQDRKFRLQAYWSPIQPIIIFSQPCLYFRLVTIQLTEMFVHKYSNSNSISNNNNNNNRLWNDTHMVHTNGTHIWYTHMVHTNGTHICQRQCMRMSQYCAIKQYTDRQTDTEVTANRE